MYIWKKRRRKEKNQAAAGAKSVVVILALNDLYGRWGAIKISAARLGLKFERSIQGRKRMAGVDLIVGGSGVNSEVK